MALGRTFDDGTWNYSGDPSNSQVDRIRMYVGDTDENFKLISDAEIEYCISQTSDDYEASYRVALLIKAAVAKYSAKSGQGFTEQLQQVYEHYTKLAEQLLTQAPIAVPKAPQLSRDKRDTFKSDTDLIQPQFGTGMLSEDAEAIRPSTRTPSADDVFAD